MKERRNTHLRNSTGKSSHEFKLGTECSNRSDRAFYNDYDYLSKLTPEDLAWLAEFSSNTSSGFKVRPEIVGEDNAEVMNNPKWLRPIYRAKNSRQRNEMYTHAFQDPEFISASDGVKDDRAERLSCKSVDSYVAMLDEIEEEIDAFWAEKHSY